jgi:hypothetical protein
MPQGIYEASHYTGIEFDGPTAAIAKLLLPQQNVLHADFTKRKLPRDFYDAAVGNFPFSKTKVTSDPEYARQELALHDYFFAKTIDRVRPGGLLVSITSRYTMDKMNAKVREHLADRADFLGAIRLPQTAFKANAGTEVVTDVIFLRKKTTGEETIGLPWRESVEVPIEGKQSHINEYFAAHPEMILGRNSLTGTMYGPEQYTVLPLEGNIEDQFAAAIEQLPENVYSIVKKSPTEQKQEVVERDFNPLNKKEGGVYLSKAGDLMKVNYYFIVVVQ